MAKEEKRESKPKGEKGKKSEKYLEGIFHRRLPDGSFVHEHHYKDKKEDDYTHPPRLMGTSPTLEDVKQHLEDHWGEGEGGAGDGQADAGADAGDAQAEAQPQPQPAGDQPDDEEAEA